MAHAELFSRLGDERLQAQELLEHAAGRPLEDDDEIDAATQRTFDRLLQRRTSGEPVAYIRGYEEFRGMRLTVRPGAFIPHQSTEFLAEQAIRRLRGRRDPVAADLAAGVGAAGLGIARALPRARVYGTDISPVAVELARANARKNRVTNIRFLTGSMFEPLPKRLRGAIDVIVSHPPYIAAHEVPDLAKELVAFEPIGSLTDSSNDGLGLFRVVVAGSRIWLKPSGWLCVEIASDLARPARAALSRAGYREVRSTHGPSLATRVVVARRPI